MVQGTARNGFTKIFVQTCSKMANFRPIKKHGTGLERWKDEKTGKNGEERDD